jgi:hypothetical protein
MPENQELEKIKNYFIREYRENGGTEDLSTANYDIILAKLEAQKQIAQLKRELEKANAAPPAERPKFNSNQQGIQKGRHNAELAKEFAQIYGAYQDYLEPAWDKRVLEDESFKRDNAIIIADKGVVLRDSENRLDCGGPTKYRGGEPEW